MQCIFMQITAPQKPNHIIGNILSLFLFPGSFPITCIYYVPLQIIQINKLPLKQDRYTLFLWTLWFCSDLKVYIPSSHDVYNDSKLHQFWMKMHLFSFPSVLCSGTESVTPLYSSSTNKQHSSASLVILNLMQFLDVVNLAVNWKYTIALQAENVVVFDQWLTDNIEHILKTTPKQTCFSANDITLTTVWHGSEQKKNQSPAVRCIEDGILQENKMQSSAKSQTWIQDPDSRNCTWSVVMCNKQNKTKCCHCIMRFTPPSPVTLLG